MNLPNRGRQFRAFVAILAGLVMTGFAWEARGAGKGYSRSMPARTPSVDVPPVDSSATVQAKQGVNTAREAVTKAQDALTTVTNKLRTDFNASPDMTAATTEFKTAQQAYDKASKPILDKVHDSDEYKAASSAHEQDETKLTDLRANSGSADAISEAASDAMTQKVAMTKLENYALQADPEVAAAKGTMSQAGAKIAKLQAAFNASLTQNSEWASAKKTLDDAKQNLATASAALRDASNTQASQQAAHNAAVAQQQKIDQEHPATPPANQTNQNPGNKSN
jgi:chromosome segregation ATPase